MESPDGIRFVIVSDGATITHLGRVLIGGDPAWFKDQDALFYLGRGLVHDGLEDLAWLKHEIGPDAYREVLNKFSPDHVANVTFADVPTYRWIALHRALVRRLGEARETPEMTTISRGRLAALEADAAKWRDLVARVHAGSA